MSLFCIYVVENVKKHERYVYTQQIEKIAKQYKYGIKFYVDWFEPVVSNAKDDALIINIYDFPESDNCEMFLLPDGWYFNGETNDIPFTERIAFLQDISTVFINANYSINLYLGQSGTNLEEFSNVVLNNDDLVEYLSKTIGIQGVDESVHIRVIPQTQSRDS